MLRRRAASTDKSTPAALPLGTAALGGGGMDARIMREERAAAAERRLAAARQQQQQQQQQQPTQTQHEQPQPMELSPRGAGVGVAARPQPPPPTAVAAGEEGGRGTRAAEAARGAARCRARLTPSGLETPWRPGTHFRDGTWLKLSMRTNSPRRTELAPQDWAITRQCAPGAAQNVETTLGEANDSEAAAARARQLRPLWTPCAICAVLRCMRALVWHRVGGGGGRGRGVNAKRRVCSFSSDGGDQLTPRDCVWMSAVAPPAQPAPQGGAERQQQVAPDAAQGVAAQPQPQPLPRPRAAELFELLFGTRAPEEGIVAAWSSQPVTFATAEPAGAGATHAEAAASLCLAQRQVRKREKAGPGGAFGLT